jgi:hypothetical protein
MDRRPAPVAGGRDPGQVARDDHAHRQYPTTEAQEAGSQTRNDDHGEETQADVHANRDDDGAADDHHVRADFDDGSERRPRRRVREDDHDDESTTTTTTTICKPVTTTTVKPKKKKPAKYRIGDATWYRYIPGHCATWYLPRGTRITIRDLATGKVIHCIASDREGRTATGWSTSTRNSSPNSPLSPKGSSSLKSVGDPYPHRTSGAA